MYDIAFIGCGVIGAAAAYALSRYDNKVVILEAENDVADCTTKAKVPVLTGGLIADKEDVLAALEAGATAISTTNQAVWDM